MTVIDKRGSVCLLSMARTNNRECGRRKEERTNREMPFFDDYSPPLQLSLVCCSSKELHYDCINSNHSAIHHAHSPVNLKIRSKPTFP
jgi:hypothetical protein